MDILLSMNFLYGIDVVSIFKDLIAYLTKSSGVDIIQLLPVKEDMMFVDYNAPVKIECGIIYVQ